MSGTDAIAYTSLAFHKKLKPELQAIADAMGLEFSEKPTVAILRKDIQAHIRTHPELADDPRFTPVFAHRTGPKAAGKNSSDKANDEAAQVPITGGAITGANRTLIQQGVKTDPPGQFSRLSLDDDSGAALSAHPQDDGDAGSDSQSHSESSSGNESPSPEMEKKAKVLKQSNAKKICVPLPDIVRVNFFDVKDPTAEPRQVPVLSNEIPISTVITADGGIVHKTFLDKVLPVAFQNDSPIKEVGGRIYRDGAAGRLHLGKIDAILDGSARPLKINEVNAYTLRASTTGDLFCDVLWDTEIGVIEAGNTGEPVVANPIASGSTFPLPANERPVFTGAGTDVPLAIATDRALHNPTGRRAAPGVREVFLRFLHSVITQEVDGVPEFGTSWPRAKYAGMLLARHLLQEQVLEMFTAWSRPTGGYIIPATYPNYAGTSFTKDEILDTLKIKSSSSSNDHLLFAPESLMYSSKAKEWMTTANFKKYLLERRERRGHRSSSDKTRVRRRSSPSSPGEGSSRKKHRKSVTESDDSEPEVRYKNSSRKLRAPKSISSETLDASE
ncbi:hypothetical protein B0H19DRAFT_1379179 [Mycena capillaripes]|nr:hypothetical protein B0H19DRAFT_1379179 [Mycena capillaripes]